MIADLVPQVREALSVSSAYDAGKITQGITRACKRLLRDYNFPKNVYAVQVDMTLEQQSITLPADFKREYFVYLRDSTDPANPLYKQLHKRPMEDYMLRQPDGVPHYYSIQGLTIGLDTPNPQAGLSLHMYYQSLSVAANEAWLTSDFEDVLFHFSTYRLAGELRKPEVVQIYGPLWEDDRTALAIYLNETEYDGAEFIMRERQQVGNDRYGR